MRFIGKVLLWLLWLFLLALALALLTTFAWWMQWPLVTGLVLLVGAIGLVLAFFGLRALYRWHDKQRFVRKVLEEQASLESVSPVSIGRLTDVWRQGMELLRRSPLRFHQRMQYSQPWFLTLDETGSSSGIFETFGSTLPAQGDSPLYWHFLSSVVMLRYRDAGSDAGKPDSDWEELLASLARNRRSVPLRGLVLLLSASDLAGRSDEALSILGQRLRSRVQQVMLTLNRRYPVHVLVQGLENLPGMDELLDVAPAEDSALGLTLTGNADNAGRRAAAAAADSLEAFVRSAAAEGRFPHGDMLAGIRQTRLFGDRLELVLEHLSREVAHQATPLLRGVFFCRAGSAGGGLPALSAGGREERPGFLRDLLSRVLPAADHPSALSGALPFHASTKIMLMTAWLALTLFVCGLLAVNTLYQHHVLTAETGKLSDVSHHEMYNAMYREMLYARRLEDARKAWYLPSLGQDMLLRVERKVKEHLVSQVYTHLLAPMLDDFRSFLSRPATVREKDMELDVARELVWLCAAISERMETGTLPPEMRTTFPLTRLDENRWSPVVGSLLIAALKWTPDGEQLNALSQSMWSLLSLSVTRKGGNLLQTIEENVNRNMPAAEVCLSQFWPHVDATSDGDQCIPPAYTASGHAALEGVLEDIESIAEKNEALQQQLSLFRARYFKRYAEVWREFVFSFAGASNSLSGGDAFAAYADVKGVEDVPHMRLFHKMATEIAPLLHADNAPAWVARFSLIDTVTEIAMARQQHGSGGWRALLSTVVSSPELLQRLRLESRDATQLRELLMASGSLQQYFDKTLELLLLLASPARSLALASLHYQTRGATERVENSPYSEAQTILAEALRPFRSEVRSPAESLLASILDFIARGVTIQTARSLQHDWETEVLSSPAALYRQDSVEALFGEKGEVQDFVNTRLKPFLTREDTELVAARWGDLVFPFTADFLGALARAEFIAANPSRDAYYVLLRSEPTLVNADASERPDSTEFSLLCQGRENRLVNRNYPRNEKFQYSPSDCGQATLQLHFPSFTLTRGYASFVDFLQDFEYGERVLGPDDFPDDAAKMKATGLRRITVRILPDNAADVLRHKANQPPTLPDRITYAW